MNRLLAFHSSAEESKPKPPANDNWLAWSRPREGSNWNWREVLALVISLALLALMFGAPLYGLGSFIASALAQASLSGRADALDGDTLSMAGIPVRLVGIDAPELRQECQDGRGVTYACGLIASRALAKLVGGQMVTCTFESRDDWGRALSVCRVGETELNTEMVRQGHALAFVKYDERYTKLEAQAKSAKAGLWAGTFEEPWEWRASVLETVLPAKVGECVIKGNISRKGERIYHMPFHAFYGRTQIDEGDGERMFCTEDEAQAAGWRRALR